LFLSPGGSCARQGGAHSKAPQGYKYNPWAPQDGELFKSVKSKETRWKKPTATASRRDA
jgi:hypothetical protein